jgi:hypothetical protein
MTVKKNTKKLPFIDLKQVFAVGISILFVSYLLFYQYTNKYNTNETYNVLQVGEDVKRMASHVQVGLFVNNFPEFSIYKNRFKMNCVVWFRFPVGTESLDTIDNFSFQGGTIKTKSKPIVKIIGDDVVVSYKVTVEFVAYLTFKYFPVGNHKLNIILENRAASQNELVFVGDRDNLRLSDQLLVESWSVQGKNIKTGYMKSELEENNKKMEIGHPSVVFSIKFFNKDFRRFVTLYLPLFLLIFLAVFALFTEIGSTSRGYMVGTSVPSIILYRLIINNLSPVSGELTKVDYVYFLLVFLSLFILFFHAYTLFIFRAIKDAPASVQKKKKLRLRNANKIVLYSVLLGLALFMTYITFF